MDDFIAQKKMMTFLRHTWMKAFMLAGALEIFSLVAFYKTQLQIPAMILIGLIALFSSLKDLRYPLALLIIEAFIGSHGHLFSVQIGGMTLTVRMMLFAILLIAWVVHVVRGCSRIMHFPHARLTAPLLLIIAMVTWGLVRAWAVGTPLSEAVADANGYAFIVCIPIMIDLASDRKSLAWLGKVGAGALAWLSLKSLLLLYFFSHKFSFLSELYVWQRKAWLTEITRLDSGIYRIFGASDVFLLLGVFIGFMLLWNRSTKKRWMVVTLMTAAFLLSLSRSFWLGGLLALTFTLPLLVRHRILTIKTAPKFISRGLLVLGSAFFLLFALVMAPVPERLTGADAFSAFSSRLSGFGDAAVSSRWNMLGPLSNQIQENPIFGSGFGKAITYQSDDPRIHDLYPGGVITTTAIEWQYLEMVMKMGIFVLFAVMWLWWRIGVYFWDAMRAAQSDDRYIIAGLLIAFLAFVFANIFTPYMNHPLGWIFLAIVLSGLHAVREGETENAPIHPRV